MRRTWYPDNLLRKARNQLPESPGVRGVSSKQRQCVRRDVTLLLFCMGLGTSVEKSERRAILNQRSQRSNSQNQRAPNRISNGADMRVPTLATPTVALQVQWYRLTHSSDVLDAYIFSRTLRSVY